MWSVCSSFHALLVPPWQQHLTKTLPYDIKTLSLRRRIVQASLKDDSPSSFPKQTQMGYDHAEELYGLDVDIPSRDAKSDASEPRSWFGPNGQYIRELPCPICRGRGYTPCVECGIERSRKDCSLCSGKGMMTCQQCMGECVIWEESIDEIPWEKARFSSPLKVKEDDEVDNLDLKLDVRKKSKRVYRSTPEVGLKISRSLKSLNAKTGLFSKRMKIIHKDPTLHAQRVAAIKKTKRTADARKQASEALKTFFSDPENRRKRSISMIGTKFFCKNCGQEGHRSRYCPEHGKDIDRRLKCGLCGERGHNRKTCGRPSNPKKRFLQHYHCGACGQFGHNRRTCSLKVEPQTVGDLTKNGSYVERGPKVVGDLTKNENSINDSTSHARKHYRCGACGQVGHNRRSCSVKAEPETVGDLTKNGSSFKWEPQVLGDLTKNGSYMKVESQSVGHLTKKGNSLNDSTSHARKHYQCGACGQVGHNRRTCSVKAEPGTVGDLTKNGSSVKREPQVVGDLTKNISYMKAASQSVDFTKKGISLTDSTSQAREHYRCGVCGELGHNRRTCARQPVEQVDVNADKRGRRPYHCRNCGVTGHNRRTCLERRIVEVNNVANTEP